MSLFVCEVGMLFYLFYRQNILPKLQTLRKNDQSNRSYISCMTSLLHILFLSYCLVTGCLNYSLRWQQMQEVSRKTNSDCSPWQSQILAKNFEVDVTTKITYCKSSAFCQVHLQLFAMKLKTTLCLLYCINWQFVYWSYLMSK